MDRQDWRSLFDEYGPAALLGVVVTFMFWVRMRDVESVIKENVVYFTAGNDPWYHARIIHLVVEHFPATQRFDPFSYFPYGTGRHSGFGGLFDQVIATAALIVGGGTPSNRLIDMTIAVAPAVFGAATAIPVYFVTRRLYDRATGLVAAVFLALFNGGFLTRTVVGTADHQSAEAFFGTFAALGFLLAVTTAYREKPTVADIRDRNWIVLRRPVLASVLGGVGIGAYLMTWGPGVMLVFTMGVFVVLQSFRDHLRGKPLEYLAFGTMGSMGVATVLTLLYVKTIGLQATAFSLIQPLVTFGVGAGSIVLYGISRYLSREGYDEWYYPPAAIGAIAVAFVVATLVYPETPRLFMGLVKRVYSFGLLKSATGLTVAELQPGTIDDLWRAYGPILFLAVAGALLVFVRLLEDRPAELFLLLWTFTMTSAFFTATRFSYYLAVNAAILGAFAVAWTARHALEFDQVETLSDVEAYQVMGVVVILILIVPGNVFAVGNLHPAWRTAEFASGADEAWQEELQWMQKNTPELPINYDKRYERPADGDFDYPEGSYGVMSWWDYGHWITKNAHRVPVANPFQQGQGTASAFFQMRNETRANLLLEALPSLQSVKGSPYQLSTGRLRSLIESQSAQRASENTRYVVIDDQMAGAKFGPIATWTGPGFSAYISTERYKYQKRNISLPEMNSKYDNIMLSRLYYDDASGLRHYRLVHESDSYSIIGRVIRNGRLMSGIRQIRLRFGWEQLKKRQLPRTVRANNQRNRVFSLGGSIQMYDAEIESRVKTYERVPGATLTGEVPEEINVSTNTTVRARLPLQTSTGRNFTYTQQTTLDPDGSFSLTVPYPTNDAVPPAAGGTDSGVEARGNYTIQVGGALLRLPGRSIRIGVKASGTASVPESAIYDGATIEVDVEAVQRNQSNTGGSSGNSTDDQSAIDDIGTRGPATSNPSDLGVPGRPTSPETAAIVARSAD